ncbi:MAG: exodeoxyribonuclease V subunit gamma, partial [Verrucomicrobia bacterium]|nr:exodeoxyribonuclease V subunit gamma [Verrucomicrobiota bacterium]
EAAGIRWGLDAEHRTSLGLPHDPATTWRAGLERMLLSLATEPEAEMFHHDVLASSGPEPATADLLGRLHAFCEALFTMAHPLTAERLTWKQWSARLLGLSGSLLSGPQKPADHVELNKQLEALGALEADYALPLEWPVVKAHLLSILEQTTQSSRFLAGKATFCALKPLRSIPFRIIAVLGLTQDAFPRRDEVPAFDLRFSEPIKVERSRREEDRELFLETLLSAREKLHLSYSGLSPTNGAESPPSVVVSELLDCIVRDALPSGDHKSRAALERQLVVHHPLQAFGERNFNGADSRVFSFSNANCLAGTASRTKSAPSAFLNGKTSGPSAAQKRVSLSELLSFFRNPARYFLRKTLNLALENLDAALPETDPFESDNLEA